MCSLVDSKSDIPLLVSGTQKICLGTLQDNMECIHAQSVREDSPTLFSSTIINPQSTLSGHTLALLSPADQRKSNVSGKNFAVQGFRKLPKHDLSVDIGDESLRKMRRVDWRWAAAKGFLDKDTNQWNEALGGLEGYIRQRTERVLARFVSVTNTT